MDETDRLKEQSQKLTEVFFEILHSQGFKKNRYAHGFTNGVITALNALFDDNKPKLEVEEYTDETVCANYGYEALELLRVLVKSPSDKVTLDKATKLVAAWQIDSHSKLMEPTKPTEGKLVIKPGSEFKFSSLSELTDLDAVIRASLDTKTTEFRRFALKPEGQKTYLVAEHLQGTDSVFTRIGEIVGGPHLNLARV